MEQGIEYGTMIPHVTDVHISSYIFKQMPDSANVESAFHIFMHNWKPHQIKVYAECLGKKIKMFQRRITLEMMF